MAIGIKTRGLILASIGLQLASCRAAAPTQSEPYGLVTEDEDNNYFTLKEFEDVRVYQSAKDCGHGASGLKLLRDEGNIKVYNSKSYLDAGLQNNQQPLNFALQWFTPDSSYHRGGTPIVRVVKKEDYKNKFFEHKTLPNNNCNFSDVEGSPNRTAMMFVYGVGSQGYGETLEQLDYIMLKALINFQVTPLTPSTSGAGKIGKLPAYVQFVANKNTPTEGTYGKHDEDAINRVAFNLDMAYRSGVEEFDILTHSNGMISAQIGYSYFAHHFMRDAEMRLERCIDRSKSTGVTLDSEKACELQVKPLKLKFYHFQAAADEIWTIAKKPPFQPGFFTNFIPVFEQTSKGSTTAILRYPPDDLHTYFFNLRTHLSWEFHYFYNNADFLTYPPTSGIGAFLFTPVNYFRGRGGFSAVGINESINWVQFALKLEKLLGTDRFKIGHYYCDEDSESTKKCGKKHSGYHSIMDASHPTKIKKNHWKVWYTP